MISRYWFLRWLWENGYAPYFFLTWWIIWLLYTIYLVVPNIQVIQRGVETQGRVMNAPVFDTYSSRRYRSNRIRGIGLGSRSGVTLGNDWFHPQIQFRDTHNRLIETKVMLPVKATDYPIGSVVPVKYLSSDITSARIATREALWGYLPFNLLLISGYGLIAGALFYAKQWFGKRNATDYSSEVLARVNRAKLLLDHYEYKEAAEEFTIAIQIQEEPDLFHWRAVARFSGGNIKGALKDLKQAINLYQQQGLDDRALVLHALAHQIQTQTA